MRNFALRQQNERRKGDYDQGIWIGGVLLSYHPCGNYAIGRMSR
jgi:hypothetical protein